VVAKRHKFSRLEKSALLGAFVCNAYPDRNTLERLARVLNCGQETVYNWFANMRKKAPRFLVDSKGEGKQARRKLEGEFREVEEEMDSDDTEDDDNFESVRRGREGDEDDSFDESCDESE